MSSRKQNLPAREACAAVGFPGKTRLTPGQASYSLRVWWEQWHPTAIPTQPCRYLEPSALSAYEVALMVQQQARCSFEDAMDATGEVWPELFAEYWMERLGVPDRPAAG